MHGFQNSFAQVFSLKCRTAIWNICSCSYTYPPPSPPPPQKKKKKKKKIFCQIRIAGQFIEKEPHTPPPNTPPNFFSVQIICQLDSVLVIFFFKLTKNPAGFFVFFFFFCFFFVGEGRLWCGGSEHNVQMFKMALLLLKENTCAKLFLNPRINVEVMAPTSSIYDHFNIWPAGVTLTFNLPKQNF